MTPIKPETINILRNMRVEGNTAYITAGQLDRKAYEDVNKVLDALGGKWNRKAKGHVFDGDPYDQIAAACDTGAMPEKNPFDFFATPDALADHVLETSGFRYAEKAGPVLQVLEPSCGDGSLIRAVLRQVPTAQVVGVEVDPKRAPNYDKYSNVAILDKNFLSTNLLEGHEFDVVVMNPPFTSPGDATAWASHIVQAMAYLRPGGLLVAICPSSLVFRTTKKIERLRGIILADGRIEENPAQSFKESGTGVNTVTAIWTKPLTYKA